MAFWSHEKFIAALAANKLIPGYSTDRLKVGAYELSMGEEYFVTADEKGKRRYIKQRLESGKQLVIPQGQFALLLTEETLEIPNNAIGFISIKAGIKFRGLVNVSGFHVDPGFRGKLKFAVHNAGPQPIILARGQPVFLIWLSDLDQPTSHLYVGDHQNQKTITPDDVAKITGDVASPAQLRKEIEKLRGQVRWIRGVCLGVLTLVFIPSVLAAWQLVFGGKVAPSPASPPPPVIVVNVPTPAATPNPAPTPAPSPLAIPPSSLAPLPNTTPNPTPAPSLTSTPPAPSLKKTSPAATRRP